MNTLKTILVFAVFGISLRSITAQIVYPKGIYATYEDFARRQPSDTTTEFTFNSSANQVDSILQYLLNKQQLGCCLQFQNL